MMRPTFRAMQEQMRDNTPAVEEPKGEPPETHRCDKCLQTFQVGAGNAALCPTCPRECGDCGETFKPDPQHYKCEKCRAHAVALDQIHQILEPMDNEAQSRALAAIDARYNFR